jgi:hypothetical protein
MIIHNGVVEKLFVEPPQLQPVKTAPRAADGGCLTVTSAQHVLNYLRSSYKNSNNDNRDDKTSIPTRSRGVMPEPLILRPEEEPKPQQPPPSKVIRAIDMVPEKSHRHGRRGVAAAPSEPMQLEESPKRTSSHPNLFNMDEFEQKYDRPLNRGVPPTPIQAQWIFEAQAEEPKAPHPLPLEIIPFTPNERATRTTRRRQVLPPPSNNIVHFTPTSSHKKSVAVRPARRQQHRAPHNSIQFEEKYSPRRQLPPTINVIQFTPNINTKRSVAHPSRQLLPLNIVPFKEVAARGEVIAAPHKRAVTMPPPNSVIPFCSDDDDDDNSQKDEQEQKGGKLTVPFTPTAPQHQSSTPTGKSQPQRLSAIDLVKQQQGRQQRLKQAMRPPLNVISLRSSEEEVEQQQTVANEAQKKLPLNIVPFTPTRSQPSTSQQQQQQLKTIDSVERGRPFKQAVLTPLNVISLRSDTEEKQEQKVDESHQQTLPLNIAPFTPTVSSRSATNGAQQQQQQRPNTIDLVEQGRLGPLKAMWTNVGQASPLKVVRGLWESTQSTQRSKLPPKVVHGIWDHESRVGNSGDVEDVAKNETSTTTTTTTTATTATNARPSTNVVQFNRTMTTTMTTQSRTLPPRVVQFHWKNEATDSSSTQGKWPSGSFLKSCPSMLPFLISYYLYAILQDEQIMERGSASQNLPESFKGHGSSVTARKLQMWLMIKLARRVREQALQQIETESVYLTRPRL